MRLSNCSSSSTRSASRSTAGPESGDRKCRSTSCHLPPLGSLSRYRSKPLSGVSTVAKGFSMAPLLCRLCPSNSSAGTATCG
eukprot:Skav219227  [mRNA]  locus=scaffold2965:111755:122656:- [translate_table: standard]